jgi:hypothetical protein
MSFCGSEAHHPVLGRTRQWRVPTQIFFSVGARHRPSSGGHAGGVSLHKPIFVGTGQRPVLAGTRKFFFSRSITPSSRGHASGVSLHKPFFVGTGHRPVRAKTRISFFSRDISSSPREHAGGVSHINPFVGTGHRPVRAKTRSFFFSRNISSSPKGHASGVSLHKFSITLSKTTSSSTSRT